MSVQNAASPKRYCDLVEGQQAQSMAGFIQKPYPFNALIEAVRKLSQPA